MKKNFAFGRINFILLAISMAVVIIGYILMSGEGSTREHFNEAIFDFRHTTLAPITCFFGYIMMIVAILYRPKAEKLEDQMIEETNAATKEGTK